MTSLREVEDSITPEGLEGNTLQSGETAPSSDSFNGTPVRSVPRGQISSESDNSSQTTGKTENNPEIPAEKRDEITSDDLKINGLNPRIGHVNSAVTWGHLFVELS